MPPRPLGDIARARLARRYGITNNPWKPKRDPGLSVGAVQGKVSTGPSLRGTDRILSREEAKDLFGFKNTN